MSWVLMPNNRWLNKKWAKRGRNETRKLQISALSNAFPNDHALLRYQNPHQMTHFKRIIFLSALMFVCNTMVSNLISALWLYSLYYLFIYLIILADKAIIAHPPVSAPESAHSSSTEFFISGESDRQ